MYRPISSALVALLAAGAGACRSDNGESVPAPAPTVVRVAEVRETTLALPVTAAGTLSPKEEVALSFKIGGVVSGIRVNAGASVRAGQTLASLDLREIDAAVARARSGWDKANRDLARAERLYNDSVFTLSQLQDTRTQAEVAQADLQTASFNRRYAIITAPASGVILDRRAEPGELVSPGQTVLVLGNRARGSVMRVGLADRDVVRIRLGDAAVVRFDALPDRQFVGHVSEIAATADQETGTYTAEVALPDAAGVTSGLVGRVEIQPGAARPVTLIPIEALLEADGEQGMVYVLSADGSTAERRPVKVGPITGDRVVITRGLQNARIVVTDGAAYLRDGQPVKAVQ